MAIRVAGMARILGGMCGVCLVIRSGLAIRARPQPEPDEARKLVWVFGGRGIALPGMLLYLALTRTERGGSSEGCGCHRSRARGLPRNSEHTPPTTNAVPEGSRGEGGENHHAGGLKGAGRQSDGQLAGWGSQLVPHFFTRGSRGAARLAGLGAAPKVSVVVGEEVVKGLFRCVAVPFRLNRGSWGCAEIGRDAQCCGAGVVRRPVGAGGGRWEPRRRFLLHPERHLGRWV